MKILQQIYFENREAFRSWLELHHAQPDGIHLLFYKNNAKPCLTYREALEEALCFGWIDSTVRSIDAESYVRMFTPRRNISNWSDINKKLVLELIKAGRMTDAGLQKIDVYQQTGRIDWDVNEAKIQMNKQEKVSLSDDFKDALMAAEPAWTFFMKLAPSHQQRYLLWIAAARREETRQRRIVESVDLLKQQQHLGIK